MLLSDLRVWFVRCLSCTHQLLIIEITPVVPFISQVKADWWYLEGWSGGSVSDLTGYRNDSLGVTRAGSIDLVCTLLKALTPTTCVLFLPHKWTWRQRIQISKNMQSTTCNQTVQTVCDWFDVTLMVRMMCGRSLGGLFHHVHVPIIFIIIYIKGNNMTERGNTLFTHNTHKGYCWPITLHMIISALQYLLNMTYHCQHCPNGLFPWERSSLLLSDLQSQHSVSLMVHCELVHTYWSQTTCQLTVLLA